MNRTIATALSLAATIAAIACVAAIASGNAYAETPTIDNTPFVSTRTRAEVQVPAGLTRRSHAAAARKCSAKCQ